MSLESIKPQKDMALVAQAQIASGHNAGQVRAALFNYERAWESTPSAGATPQQLGDIANAEAALRSALDGNRVARSDAGAWKSDTPYVAAGTRPPWVP